MFMAIPHLPLITLQPKTFFWVFVSGNAELDSFYLMITTDYIFQKLNSGKYVPCFMIRIKLPDICCSYFME